MSISTKLSEKFQSLTDQAKKRLVKMAWSDKVSVQAIKKEFDFTANELEKFMRSELPAKDFKRWKIRLSKRFNQKSKKAAMLRELTD